MKNIIHFLIGVIIGAITVFILYPAQQIQTPSQDTGAIRYNCELSAGTFEDEICSCPLEMPQTQDEMYDKTTGFCQSTIGGPAGAAFPASIGLPYGDYGYWNSIIQNLCVQSGGTLDTNPAASCICPSTTTYDKTTGQCQQ